ncbi:MAG: tributyrin esterase [Planctomycetota bacterium]
MSDPKSERPDRVIDLAQADEVELRAAINQLSVPDADSDEQPPLIELLHADGRAASCMGWKSPVRVRAAGDWGHYAWAYNQGPDVHLYGNVGDGIAEGMADGIIRVHGNAGCGAGAAMTAGTLAIYGSAGPRCGAAMRGGGVFVLGDVGDDAGVGALAGTIVVGGDAGRNLGDRLHNVTVFIRGTATSLAPGVTKTSLRKKEEVRLGLLLMSASIRGSASDFQRVIPVARLEAEEAGQGELRPNWR